MNREYTEEELQIANKEKLAKAIEWLGSKWLLHKDNTVVKNNVVKNTLKTDEKRSLK